MNLKISIPISRKQWLAALQVRGEADETLTRRMDEAEKLIAEAASPKATYRIMPVSDIRTEGDSIKKHLEGCHSVAVMALTLGAGIDMLIRKTQVTDMALAVIIDCGASVLTEQLANEYEQQIHKDIAGKTGSLEALQANQKAGDFVTPNSDMNKASYTTPRFSPGYGDYPIEMQKHIIGYTDATRQIGLNITSDFLMVPRKSVTALIGISDKLVTGSLATCDTCVLRDKCELKKEGKICGN